MENAGKFIEDEELREQRKGSGIGTSATRAEIIKKLDLAEQTETYKIIKSNYQFLGRRHLKEFMISIEWAMK